VRRTHAIPDEMCAARTAVCGLIAASAAGSVAGSGPDCGAAASSLKVVVAGAGEADVNGEFVPRPSSQIPAGFADTCHASNWEPAKMWRELSESGRAWFESANGSYFYWNRGDGHWWLDGPSGAGLYIAHDDGQVPPLAGWKVVTRHVREPMPAVRVELLD